MDIKIVDQAGKEVKPVEQKVSDTEPSITGDLLEMSVGQLFDMRPNEIQASRDQIRLLVEYAKSVTDDHTSMGIKWAIRSLQGRVGTPPLGQKWLPYLTQYAYIKLESLKIQKEVEKYEHN